MSAPAEPGDADVLAIDLEAEVARISASLRDYLTRARRKGVDRRAVRRHRLQRGRRAVRRGARHGAGVRHPHARAGLLRGHARLQHAASPTRSASTRSSRTSRRCSTPPAATSAATTRSGWCARTTDPTTSPRSCCRASSTPTASASTRWWCRRPTAPQSRHRLTTESYLGIVAATNFKQRTRKMLEYYHADRLNYVVTGTPNRLEYDQGFFVKLGDGAADVKPIAHLYKTQVYALAEHLGVPEADPHPAADDRHLLAAAVAGGVLLLAALRPDGPLPATARTPACRSRQVAEATGLTHRAGRARVRATSTRSGTTTAYLHLPPQLVEPVRGDRMTDRTTGGAP